MPTTKKNEIAPVENYALITPYTDMDPEVYAELQDEMSDLDQEAIISYRQIKIPAGGKTVFEVQGEENGEEEYLKEIDGVVVFTHQLNGYWPNAFGTSNNPEDKIPVCSSIDGKFGVNVTTGAVQECMSCPFNQFGTDPKGGKGKACKNMRRIYLMRANDTSLYLLTVPPTSTKEVNKALARIMARGLPYTNIVVSLKLQKATNSNGIDYCTVVIEKKGALSAESAEVAKKIRAEIKNKYTGITFTFDDYAAQPAQLEGNTSPNKTGTAAAPATEVQFSEATAIEDDEVPFI